MDSQSPWCTVPLNKVDWRTVIPLQLGVWTVSSFKLEEFLYRRLSIHYTFVVVELITPQLQPVVTLYLIFPRPNKGVCIHSWSNINVTASECSQSSYIHYTIQLCRKLYTRLISTFAFIQSRGGRPIPGADAASSHREQFVKMFRFL